MKSKILNIIKIFSITGACNLLMACPDEQPSGGGVDTRPACTQWTTEIIFVPTVNLSYNFAGAPANFTYADFRMYHPAFTGQSGVVHNFDDIVNDFTANAYWGKSSMNIKIFSSNCSGSIPFLVTNSSNAFGKWLYSFPLIDAPHTATKTATCNIESVKTIHGDYMKWSFNPVVEQGYGKITAMQGTGIVKTSYTYGGIYLRPPHGGGVIYGEYIVIENASIDYDYDNINWTNINLLTDERLSNNYWLTRSVYIDGEYDDNIRWNAPVYCRLY